MDLKTQLLIAALATSTAIILLIKAVIELQATRLKFKNTEIPQAPKQQAAPTSKIVQILNISIGRFGWVIPLTCSLLFVSQLLLPLSKLTVFVMFLSVISILSWMIGMVEERLNRLFDILKSFADFSKDLFTNSNSLNEAHLDITRRNTDLVKHLADTTKKAEQDGSEQPATRSEFKSYDSY